MNAGSRTYEISESKMLQIQQNLPQSGKKCSAMIVILECLTSSTVMRTVVKFSAEET